jgi:PhnB protein
MILALPSRFEGLAMTFGPLYRRTLQTTAPTDEPTGETVRRAAMSRVSTYLNFMGTTEEAFSFYSSVFGTEITGEIARMGDMPSGPGAPELSEAEKKMVAHVELPILAGHVLMGTDMLESMGHELKVGNNVTICLEPDTRAESDRLYAALSEGGSESTGMQQMPWAYWGCSLDRFGIRWMFNCYEPAP